MIGGGGIEVDDALGRLASVGLMGTVQDGTIDVEVPGSRADVHREIDLIEELVRVDRGYERVPATLPVVRGAGGLPPAYAFRRRAKELLADLGFSEVRALSFASAADLELMGDEESRAIRVANPLVADESFLRTRLTPGLLRVLQHNRTRNVGSARIFECGVVFRSGAPVEEVHKLAFAMAGDAPVDWSSPARSVDVFDATGTLAGLMTGLGVRDWSLGDAAPEPFHPGRSATVLIGGRHAGVVGEIHPRVCDRFDLAGRAAIGVMAVGALFAAADGGVAAQDAPRFPPVNRDLAFVVSEDVPVAALQAAIADADLVGSVRLFDVFRGDALGDGRVSLAFAVELRAPDRTLTDDEVAAAVAQIADVAKASFDATLRE